MLHRTVRSSVSLNAFRSSGHRDIVPPKMVIPSSAQGLRLDMHVHMVSNAESGHGGWLRLRGTHRWLAGFMLRQIGLPPGVLTGDLEGEYIAYLLGEVRSAPSLDAVILLAHEQVYDPDGTVRKDLGSMYVPNDVVLKLAREHREFIPAVSIHPARADAIEELERCAEAGAVMMKCLPNCQNIDCSDPRYRPFWERMAELGLPLLAHTAGENTVPVVNSAYSDPRLLELPLECGVTVIAAHCATKSGLTDRDYFSDWVAMLRKYPNLYGDISALVSLNRCGHLKDCLSAEILPRILHGSDFPVPVLGHRLWARGWFSWKVFRECQRIENPLERDWQYKRSLGFRDDALTRIGALLPKRWQESLQRAGSAQPAATT